MLRSLYFQVLVAIALGILVGHYFPATGVALKPLSDGFIKLIKMMIGPLVFCTLVTGVAGMRSMKNVGRVGFKAIVYFEVMTTLALALGLLVMNVYRPGEGMHIDPATLDAGAVEKYAVKSQGVVEFLLGMVPATLSEAFVKGDMLQILVVSLLFAAGLLALGEKGYQLSRIIQEFSGVLFKIIGFIVRLAPLGAFGAMAFTVGQYGVEKLLPLLHLMGVFYATCVLFVAIGLSTVMRLCGFRLWGLLKYLKEELFIVLGTSSSEAALPRLMEKMERAGCSRAVVGLVVPTGYSFNLDGTCIYLTMAALFIAQALDMPLDFGQQLLLLAVLLLTSKGAAGVTGSGFVVLAASLSTVGHVPVAGLALILGIDRFMSEARAITNFIGNAVATVAVSRWERAVDGERMREALK